MAVLGTDGFQDRLDCLYPQLHKLESAIVAGSEYSFYTVVDEL